MSATLLELMKDTSGYDRTFKRYRVNLPASVRKAPEQSRATGAERKTEDAAPGLVYNLSLSGLGFVCSPLLALGDEVCVTLTLESREFTLPVIVRWQEPVERPGKAVYRYGAQFVRTEATLEFLPVAAWFLRARGGSAPSRV